MSFCRACGKEVNEQAVACTSCGVNPSNGKKFCHSCGSKSNDDAIICIKCGISLRGKTVGSLNVGTNPDAMQTDMAILWFILGWLFCGVTLPIGYMGWNQSAKGWTILAVNIVIGGPCFLLGMFILIPLFFNMIFFIAWYVVYWMCWNVQQKRVLGEWEFFPTK